MKQIKLSSAIVYLMAFDVVREWVSPFPSYRKDNYIVKYLQLTEPLFSIVIFSLKIQTHKNTIKCMASQSTVLCCFLRSVFSFLFIIISSQNFSVRFLHSFVYFTKPRNSQIKTKRLKVT